jgi:hypothetical protein
MLSACVVGLTLASCGARSALLQPGAQDGQAASDGRAQDGPIICTAVPSTIIHTESGKSSSGGNASMAADSSGRLHIAFGSWQGLRYATNASGSWKVTPIAADGADVSLAVDGAGAAHVSYSRFAKPWEYEIVYATYRAGAWTLSIIDTLEGASAVEMPTSLALDSSGRAHLAYTVSNKAELRYATNAAGAWKVVVLAEKVGGTNAALTVDRSGGVHISYAGQGLQYATNVSGSWKTETIDPAAGLPSSSLAADSAGTIHISYETYSTITQRYATNVSGAWSIELIDLQEGGSSAIAVSEGGKVHTSFVTGMRELRYATNADGAWKVRDIDPGREVEWWSSSIVLGRRGEIPISYRAAEGGPAHLLYTVLCP